MVELAHKRRANCFGPSIGSSFCASGSQLDSPYWPMRDASAACCCVFVSGVNCTTRLHIIAHRKTTNPGLSIRETERRPRRLKPALTDFFLWPDKRPTHSSPSKRSAPRRSSALLRPQMVQAPRRAVPIISRQAGEWFSGGKKWRRKDGSITWNRNETRQRRL